jgi:hypothetical protein
LHIPIIAEYLTLSKAFSKSIFIIMIGYLVEWQICRYSKAQLRQS